MRILAIRVDMNIFFLLLLLTLSNSAEVDNLNILLPELKQSPPTLPLQLISAQDGCYDWTSSQPQIVNLQPLTPTISGCSRQAVVSVNQLGPFSSTLYVTAKDAASQSFLSIPVRIRKINKITIATKSRMMNIKQIQKIELFAFDSDGNTFTSLEGMRFKWQLQQQYSIIESVLIQDAHLYLPLRTRENIQKKGYQSDMIVVRAIAPGNLKVTVQCIESGYEYLFDQITISVHQRFELRPSVIRIATDTSYQLKLFRPNSQQIVLPQSYYRISSCIGFSVDNTLLLKTPNQPSTCTLKVQDTRTKPPYSSTVDIIVQTPTELRIITDPLIVVGQQSKFHVQLIRNGAILLGESQKVTFSSDFILFKNRNILVSQKKGSGKLIAKLNDLKNEVIINSYLLVSVILPINYIHLPVGQQFKLRVVGGTGVYDFQISNDIASINSLTVLLAKSIGEANITVKDRNHPANKMMIHLKVSHISQIQSLESTKQVNRDEWGYLYVIAKNSVHETYTQCYQSQFLLSVPSSKLDIDKKVNFQEVITFLQYHNSQLVQEAIKPTSFLKGKHYQIITRYQKYVEYNEIDSQDLRNYVKGLQNYGICKAIKFKSIVALEQKVQIELEGEEQIFTKIPLRVYPIISNTIQGDNSVFLMTPESSLKWSYVGGSYSWPGSKTILLVNGKHIQQQTFPIITCPNKQVSLKNYELKIFNSQTKSLLFPTSQILNIDLICKFPKKLHVDLQYGDSFEELYIESSTKINGEVKATDQRNQIFYNSSNVKYQYETHTGNINYQNITFRYQSVGRNDTVSIFSEQLNSGIHFKRVNLEMNIYVINPIVIEHPLAPIQKTVKNISITTLFTPKKPYVLGISQLHSNVQFQCSGAIGCEKGQNYIAVKLNRLGRGEMMIRDKRIYGSQNWYFEFIIVQPDQVKITGQKDFVQVGELVRVSVNNYYKGRLISPFTYEPSYIQLINTKNIKVVEQNGNVFILRADEANQYQIYGQNIFPKTIRSLSPFNLTVYKQISPNIQDIKTTLDKGILVIDANTALILGCRRLIRIQGGPKNMKIKFHADSSNIKIQTVSNRALSISSSTLGYYLIEIQASLDQNILAIILISVTISNIQSVQLQSIEEPVVGAQFRIHPLFKIGNTNLEESTCDFQFIWEQSKGNVRLGQSVSFGLLDGAGINVIPLKAGNQIIIFKVKQRATNKILLSQNKFLQILDDFSLHLPTYINKHPCCQQGSIIMPPSSKYSFDENAKLIIQDGLVHLGQDKNILESDKKLGHTTITLTRPGFRSVNIQIQIKNIVGLYIQNDDGYLSIDPHSEKAINIYLQDNNGRLFISPLQNLQILAQSSNSELLQVKLSSDKTQLQIKSYEQGICTLFVLLPGKNIMDSIVVSIGSGLSPSKYVKIAKNGIIQFRAAHLQGTWSSSQPSVASVNQQTGIVSAHNVGTTKISYGQLFSTVDVVKIEQVRQVGHQIYKGNSLQIQYQLLWQGTHGLQQISHIKALGPVNNNLDITCTTNHRYLVSKINIVAVEKNQRAVCSISNEGNQKWPSQISVIINAGNQQLGSFNYQFKPQFTIPKKHIQLSSKSLQAELQINTPVPLNLTIKNGNPKWVKSNYQSKYKKQKISIDMQNHPNDLVWWIALSSSSQLQQVQIRYKVYSSQQQQQRSFWSFKLDWPDYLIIIMALVFGGICYIQYTSQEKIKTS